MQSSEFISQICHKIVRVFFLFIETKNEQAWAELCQAQLAIGNQHIYAVNNYYIPLKIKFLMYFQDLSRRDLPTFEIYIKSPGNF